LGKTVTREVVQERLEGEQQDFLDAAAATTTAATALDDLEAKLGGRYPAIIRLWRTAWAEFIPFLDYEIETRKIIISKNTIESLNAR
jgi:transposase-like protein